MTAPLQICSAAGRMDRDFLTPSPVSFLRRQPAPTPGSVPPEFKWVSVKMEVTTWVITITLSMVGLGVWNGGTKLADLTNAIKSLSVNDTKQDQTNEKQDREIRALETLLARQQGYLEQILNAVESNGRRIPR